MSMIHRLIQYPALSLFLLAMFASPVSAQTVEPPVVRAVLFTSRICTFCRQIVERDLPPLQAQYGSELEILLVEANELYEIASRYDISQKEVGVAFLIMGEQTVIASDEVTWELPGLIKSYLAAGGVPLPEISELESFSSQVWFSSLTQDLAIEHTNVHIILFSTPDCNACQIIQGQALDLVSESYGEQVTVETIDIVTGEDVEYLYQVAARFGISKDQVDLPLVIIGNQVLIGEEIPLKLPALIETYLQLGGVERPDVSIHHSNGFTLAIVIMALMSVALLYSFVAFAIGKTFSLPTWVDWLIPVLIIVGIGVAGYLSYVETQSVEAVCGPIGDCNAVQQSRYATLFGTLPVGVLGLIGYGALLAAWLARKLLSKFERPAAIGYFGVASLAVTFSLYLTYLEPFIIRAVCIWCLTSSVIVTLLLLLGTGPVVHQFTPSCEDE